MATPLLLWLQAFLLIILLLPCAATLHKKSNAGTTKYEDREVVANHGVVAADDGRCSVIGMNVLREGGHAVDAAVATALCLGVVSPASSGIGGGAFMLIRLANGTAQAFDMRETAPMQASQDMYAGNATKKDSGALSIAVPGELAGLHEAWKQHGRLTWERLVRPAEKLARSGFRISPYLYSQMVRSESGILVDKGLRDIFTSNGKLLQPNDICYNKKLAEALRIIAINGAEAFYNGSVGSNLVRDIQEAGGIITREDLQMYQVKIRKPISANILGLKIIGMPPPSSGAASMTLILNILAEFGVPEGISGPLGIHRQIEALKHAFAVRMNLGDPDFVNITEVLSDMLSPGFAHQLKKTIYDNMTFDPGYYGGRWNQINDHGTSHVSIVDNERNVVSMTSTVNSYFGAQILSPSTGIVLNNEMDDFSMPINETANGTPPAPANFISPGKRPLSSMTPTVVLKLIPNIVQYENWTTVYNDHFEIPADTRAFLQKRDMSLKAELVGPFANSLCKTSRLLEEINLLENLWELVIQEKEDTLLVFETSLKLYSLYIVLFDLREWYC
ncbi:hypothetical protein GH714_036815 [Hevea brasiliensis]|uniref:Glutathione hydrolase n=1 Tax=Hevea brasiliensis TaxID=3981 RepID=A0A6A6KWT5_HEVBR|nr:hypothetical protein GH714_036815 [Hevea brasiliensis]